MVPEVETETETEEETVVVDASETVVDEAPEATAEANPTIIVESSDDGASEAEIERAVDTAVAITQLQSAVEDIAEAQAQTVAVAADAQFTAEVAIQQTNELESAVVEPMADAVAETVEEDLDLEPDDAPETAGRHWFFRSWNEWKERRNR